MTPIIYFDVCALIIIIVAAFSIVFRKMFHGLSNHLFIALVAVIFADIVFDLWAVTLDMVKSTNLAARYISHTGYLLFRNSTMPVYTLYIISLTDTWHMIKGKLSTGLFITFPITVIFVSLLFNPITHDMFYIDENFVYTRGDLFWVAYICAMSYVGFGMYYIIKSRDLFRTSHFISMLVIYPLTLSAVAIQCLLPMCIVELFFTSVAVIIIAITIQRPEELVDMVTELGKHAAYADAMKKNFMNKKEVGIIFINISNYTSVSSMLGYDQSSRLLKDIADKLNAINKDMRLYAELYYLDRGGFRVVVNKKNWDKLELAAQAINSELKKSMIISQLELNIMAYVCVAYCPADISDFKSLISFGSDLSSTVPYSGNVLKASEVIANRAFKLNNEIDNIIDDALANRKFSVYYQPIFSVEQGRFISAEALLRLQNEKFGFIPPDVFITAAEKSGAIHRIGDYVLEEVCHFISGDEFKELGLDYIEINLSVAQCMQSDLADKVLEIMNKYGVAPDKINLEITETAASYAQNVMMNNLEKLTQAGISFSLDDYGTGYSNIKSVASLPISIVKLDKTFVDEEDNPRMWIVLQNTIKMLKDMDMSIVVEGVENAELAKKFADLNCEFIQGYYYSKPVPKSDFITFMKNSAS
ncbi:MAG: GGDEF domain-containing protein [Oscillospiraceae bacterium]|nr:GGDEF domain-containing protein [Oscillospiraceae bacterium]